MTVNIGQFQNDKIRRRILNSRSRQAGAHRSLGTGADHARFGQTIQRTCSCGQHTIGGGSCAACRQNREESLPGIAANDSRSQRKPDAAMSVDGSTDPKAVDFSRIPASADNNLAQTTIAQPLLTLNRARGLIERESDPALIMRKAPHGQSCESVPFGESEEEDQNSVMAKPDSDLLQRKSEAAGSGSVPMTAINPIRISARPIQSDALIQAYSLKGFPEDKKSKMDAAISAAISKTQSCEKLSWWGKTQIPKALGRLKYIYKPDLGLCGWTFPASWYIKVGKSAFDKSTCCDLESTLAHEASHTQFYTEGKARKMECNCFGCSC